MQNVFAKWLNEKRAARRVITLDDVTPLHPYEYPARHLKERLDARRDELDEILANSPPTGMPEGPNY